MSQSNPTPAWGTPVTPAGSSPVAETQVLAPVSQVAPPQVPTQQPPRPGVTRDQVELRVTALHYAHRILGDQPGVNPDAQVTTVLRQAKIVERYLLTGDPSAV